MPKYGKGKVTFDNGEEFEVEDFQIELAEKMGIDVAKKNSDRCCIVVGLSSPKSSIIREIAVAKSIRKSGIKVLIVDEVQHDIKRMEESLKDIMQPIEISPSKLKSQNFDLKHVVREEKHFEKFNYKTKRGKRKWR